MKREYAIDKLIENADKCVNMLDLCHRMGIENVGGEDYKEVRNLAKELGIELVFSYKKIYWNKNSSPMDLKDILVENSSYKNTNRLKDRLIKEGIKKYKCENPECGLSEWHGKPISLQLHHINGNHHDNRLENLQLLCPNCHSQTENYAGRNSGKMNNKAITKNKHKTEKRMTKSDWSDFREKIWLKNHPSKKTLIELFEEEQSFVGIAKKYNVSDNAVRKWFKKYNLPFHTKEMKKYIKNKED